MEANEQRKLRKKSGIKRNTAGVGEKILLIDDNPDVALLTAVQEEGYELVTCESAQKAWGLAYPFRPDFIIVHLHHPSTRDVAILQECRALAEGVPVIVATSVPGYETIMKALEEGATAFLFLPIKPLAIRKVLDGLETSVNK